MRDASWKARKTVPFDEATSSVEEPPPVVHSWCAPAVPGGAEAAARGNDGPRQRAEEQYRQLVEHLPAVLYRVDLRPYPRTTYISAQLSAMLGFTPEEWVGDPDLWVRQVHPEDADRVLAEVKAKNVTGGSFDLEYRALTREGRLPWLRNQAVYLPGADGRPAVVLGVILDVTRTKTAEMALAERELQLRIAQRLESLGQLAGGIVHDLNNLLTPIIGYSRQIHDEVTDLRMRAELEEVVRAGERAAELIRRLQAFGRSPQPDVRATSLNRVVEDVERLLRRTLGEDIVLETRLDESAGLVRADAGRLVQVVMNLVVNARDAMPRGGRLEIRTSRLRTAAPRQCDLGVLPAGRYVTLAVRDNGGGMAPGVREHVFDAFFTTKDSRSHSGLGLSTVRSVVEECGGAIEVDSAPGDGTRFRLHFPESDPPPAPQAAAESRELAGGAETVLLVEDDLPVRRLMARLLHKLGYVVLEAIGGREALDLSARHEGPIHLLVTDVVMPGMSGPELAEEIRRRRPRVGVMFVTGFTSDELQRYGLKAGAVDVLMKPFSTAELARRVRGALDRLS